MNIPARYQKLLARLNKAKFEIENLQSVCKHPRAVSKAGANTGNYDSSADMYWYDWTCPDCKKIWRTEQ
jgi:hypothetical protein